MSNAGDVAYCYADNTGVVETADDIISCGACFTIDPADVTIVKAIAECAWCLYEMGVNACITGYCFGSKGGSQGEDMCNVVSIASNYPLWMLPGGQGFGYFLDWMARGCSSDEATDCTSPLI